MNEVSGVVTLDGTDRKENELAQVWVKKVNRLQSLTLSDFLLHLFKLNISYLWP